MGLTSGGPQDIAAARSQILNGGLPDPGLITVEGFFSEHDVPLPPPEDTGEIYASLGLAWRKPFLEPAAMAEVYVRLGTTIDAADYTRRAQNLVLVVDRSGSMGDYAALDDEGDKLDAVQQALRTLLDRLTSEDRLSMISFAESPRRVVDGRAGTEREAIAGAIGSLHARGSTDLYSALQAGFEQAVATSEAPRDNRVILFTDALPTAGTQNEGAFVQLAEDYAGRGVGLTVMSVGVSFGDELADKLGRVPLANTYYLADAERIASIFEEEFDYFISPAGHDLRLTIAIPAEIGIRDVYGVADYVPGARGAEVTIPTLFFSRREGGAPIIVRLTFATAPEFTEAVALGEVSLSYTLPDGTTRWKRVAVELPAGLDRTADPGWYSDEAVRRAALLLDTVLVLQEANETARAGRRIVAAELIDEFLAEFDTRSLGLSDRTDATSRGLSDERDLLEALAGAGGYGWYYY